MAWKECFGCSHVAGTCSGNAAGAFVSRYTAVCGGTVTFPARDRGILSVFCLGADARDVSIQGGQYPLHHAVLTAEFPLGVSNHFVGRPITVSVRDGSLLIGVVED